VNRERQERVEEKKILLAGEFYDRKILRKCFHFLQSPPNSLNELLTYQTTTTTPKSQTSRQNSVPQLKSTGFQGKSSNNLTQNKNRAFGSTYNSVAKTTKPLPSKEKMTPEKTIIRPEKQPVQPKFYSPIGNRSKSAGKILKEANAANASMSRAHLTERGKISNNNRTQKCITAACSPTNKQKVSDSYRFGKSVTHINDRSGSEEITLNSQNALKTPKNIEQDQSFGYKNANNSFERCDDAYESILAEIHQSPDFAQDSLLVSNCK